MSPETVLTQGRMALEVAILVSAPLLVTALIVGLIIGLFQAATQIQEMTLSFIPKLLALALVMVVAGPWMLRVLCDYAITLYRSIPDLIG